MEQYKVWTPVCLKCAGTGSVLIWAIDHPVVAACGSCKGTGKAKEE